MVCMYCRPACSEKHKENEVMTLPADRNMSATSRRRGSEAFIIYLLFFISHSPIESLNH